MYGDSPVLEAFAGVCYSFPSAVKGRWYMVGSRWYQTSVPADCLRHSTCTFNLRTGRLPAYAGFMEEGENGATKSLQELHQR